MLILKLRPALTVFHRWWILSRRLFARRLAASNESFSAGPQTESSLSEAQ